MLPAMQRSLAFEVPFFLSHHGYRLFYVHFLGVALLRGRFGMATWLRVCFTAYFWLRRVAATPKGAAVPFLQLRQSPSCLLAVLWPSVAFAGVLLLALLPWVTDAE